MSNVAIDPPLFIDSIVNYCDKLYQQPFSSCTREIHIGTSQCEECLRVIHYETVDTSYPCSNSCYVYICKYAHKYASEIYKALEEIDFSTIPHPRVLSLGCGPATELCALDYLKSVHTIQGYDYTGVDLNDNWSTIQKFYRENSPNRSNIIFQIDDANNFIDQCTITDYDLIIFNYFFSDMVTFAGKEMVRTLLDNLVRKMHSKAYYPKIIFNDIAIYFTDQEKGAADIVMDKLCSVQNYQRRILRYFKNEKSPNFSPMDWANFTRIEDNSLSFTILPVCANYNPYATMSAAQIILQTE